MNYLAHVYLSNTDEALTIGNLIADHVKGKAYLDYPETIQKGILLHRKIDQISPWILRFFLMNWKILSNTKKKIFRKVTYRVFLFTW